jgi:hypothetical protein
MAEATLWSGKTFFLGVMIAAREVNSLIDHLAAARPQPGSYCEIRESSDGYALTAMESLTLVPHPWMTTARWDAKAKQWNANVVAGFVNGIDPLCAAVDPQTGKPVSVGLTADPVLPLLSVVDRTAGSLSGVDLPIPAFFAEMGAAVDKSVSLDSSGNITQGENAPGWRRLLSCDLYLSIARLGVNGTIQVNDNPGGGSVTSLVPSFDSSALATYGTRPRFKVIKNLKIQQEETAAQKLFATWTGQQLQPDIPYDELLVSTVFFLSPPQTDAAAPLDGSWKAYVQHFVFYNLLYAAQTVAQFQKPLNPIVLYTGLAGGLGDAIVNEDLSTINDTSQALATGLAQVSQKGMFWSI